MQLFGGRPVLVVVTLFAVTLASLDAMGVAVVDSARTVTRTVVGPIRSGGDVILDPIGDAWNGATNYDELEAENELLRRRVEALAATAAAAESDRRAFDDLLGEVGLEPFRDHAEVVARVSGRSFSNFDPNIEIDRGSLDGIEDGMTVVSAAGLVGRIVEVTPNRSVVRPLTDTGFSVGVRLVRARDVVLARGEGVGQPLLVEAALELDSELELGDLAETSGLERSPFPQAIPVGTITDVESDGVRPVRVTIEPFVDLDRLSVVRVLIPTPT